MSAHSARTVCLAAALGIIGLLNASPATAQPDPGTPQLSPVKRALLGHHLPLAPPAGDARRRPDTVGAFDLVEVGITMRFVEAQRLPRSVRYAVEIEPQIDIREGFPLLAAFYVPLAIEDDDGNALEFVHEPATGELVVFLDRVLRAGERYRYVIDAELTLECGEPPGCIDGPLLHLAEAAWYPMSLEFPVDDRFTIVLDLDVPAQVVATGSGSRVGEPERREGRYRAVFRTQRETILPALAVGDYQVSAGALGVELLSPRGPDEGRRALQEISEQTVRIYDALLGPYPFERLGVAAISTDAGAGIGPQANILLPDVFWFTGLGGPDLTRLVQEVTSHEIGHQYFFNLIGVVDADEAWMSESFAEYAATRASESITGTRDHARRNYWTYMRAVEPREDVAIFGEEVRDNPYYFEIVYLKGSAALHALRARVGTERFDEAMRAYVAALAGELTTTAEFEATLSGALGEPLADFFGTWIYRPGTVELTVSTTRGRVDEAPITIDIRQSGRAAPVGGPLPLRLHGPGGVRDITVELDALPATVELDDAQWLEVDPELSLFRRLRPDPAGDVNFDGVVDGMDLLDVWAAQGRQGIVNDEVMGPTANPDWQDRVDVQRDEVIDTGDLDLLIQQFGSGW